MKTPDHKRESPKPRRIGPAPAGKNVQAAAQSAKYVGSAYHKDRASFAGAVPHPRPNANLCPHALNWQQPQLTGWLRQAISQGHFSTDWRGGFPHKVWYRDGDVVYEGIGDSNGDYHGYPLEPDEVVIGLP